MKHWFWRFRNNIICHIYIYWWPTTRIAALKRGWRISTTKNYVFFVLPRRLPNLCVFIAFDCCSVSYARYTQTSYQELVQGKPAKERQKPHFWLTWIRVGVHTSAAGQAVSEHNRMRFVMSGNYSSIMTMAWYQQDFLYSVLQWLNTMKRQIPIRDIEQHRSWNLLVA